jgi:hypothetical protein
MSQEKQFEEAGEGRSPSTWLACGLQATRSLNSGIKNRLIREKEGLEQLTLHDQESKRELFERDSYLCFS